METHPHTDIIDEKVECLEIHHALTTLSECLSAGLEVSKHGKHSSYGANAINSCSTLNEYPWVYFNNPSGATSRCVLNTLFSFTDSNQTSKYGACKTTTGSADQPFASVPSSDTTKLSIYHNQGLDKTKLSIWPETQCEKNDLKDLSEREWDRSPQGSRHLKLTHIFVSADAWK